MKKLFICCTDYQLINSLNIKMNIFSEEKADVIIFNSKEENQGIAERLKELNVFDNVYLYDKPKSAIRRYFQESERSTLFCACKKDFLYFLHKIKSKFKMREYLINSNICMGG